MYRSFILFLFFLALLSLTAPAGATVIYVSGDVSGTWSADTVIVLAEVRVPPGQSLTIQPGVEVLFWDHYKFIVDSAATLLAVGTPTDSIRFDELWSGYGWKGIRFLSASSSSQLTYCHLKNGSATGSGEDSKGGAIYCITSNPTIQHCLIDSCAASYGGGISCNSNSSPTISNNAISGNSSTGINSHGGGIDCSSSSPTISNNAISGNSSTGINSHGGGIDCSSSSPSISGNTISGNSASQGGGIFCELSFPSIIGNTLSGNSATGGYYNQGGGIFCYNSSPSIIGNTLSANSASQHGGGIFCYNSSPTISGNIISGNSGQYYGGGICCWSNSNPVISGNTISGNSAPSGGGIYCYDFSSPSIIGNTLSGNSASSGGGILCQNSSPGIIGNTISGNSATSGGGIYFLSPPDTFELNEISENTASGSGGGIYLGSANISMNKNTIVFNNASSGGGLYSSSSNATAVNCILWGNAPEQIAPSGPVVLATYCDIGQYWPGTGNINQNPLFVNPIQHNYHLQWDSPCIDTGDPNPIYNDPDGTRADIGAWYYDQSQAPQIVVSADSISFGPVVINTISSRPLTIYNTGTATLVIQSINSNLPVFSTNYNPSDSLIAAGDSLNLLIHFQPIAISVYDGVLTVLNNDETETVTLSGSGVGPVDVSLVPVNPPIIIAPGGGSFNYLIGIHNLSTINQTIDLWTQIEMPGFGMLEIMNRSNIPLPPGYNANRTMTQQVPAFAPAGTYIYYAYVGDYPWIIQDVASFTFEKSGANQGGSLGSPSDWLCSGESFEITANAIPPSSFNLHPCSPNPFNPTTVLSYELRVSSLVSLKVYDTTGRLVATLVNGWREAGSHEVTFDGSGLPSGVYLARLQAGDYTGVQKLVLLK